MEDLTDTTFLIPLKVEHPDRLRNARTTLGYLNHHLATTIIIHELTEDGISKLDFLDGLQNLAIKHLIRKEGAGKPYHRTKYLNEMLELVDTPVACNYDIDVILPPKNYRACSELIREGVAVCYPYGFGVWQYQVSPQFDYRDFRASWDIGQILEHPEVHRVERSEYGHCVFLSTEEYRKWGGENEAFVSYGPEDQERAFRFKALTQSVRWLTAPICHFEHFRGPDSSQKNRHFRENARLFEKIKSMSLRDLEIYYLKAGYRESYPRMASCGKAVSAGTTHP